MRTIDYNWNNLNREEMVELLTSTDPDLEKELFAQAYQTKLEHVGNKVYFRGIIELSNVCSKDCYYCGIRRGNTGVKRFIMTDEEVLEAAKWAYESNYGSVVLQTGERSDPEFVDHIERLLYKIKDTWGLGITLSLGEQTRETYERWYRAGAHRYLLRIEASNPDLYARLHPPDHSWEVRRNCLLTLRECGYQVGTGVMIGLPWQTPEDLVHDIDFFREMDIDMVGMGPYVIHNDTPLAGEMPDYDPEKQLGVALRMIALTRLTMKDINIASTTALQALDPLGREKGLQAGANIIMPVITDLKYRRDYLLYQNKPCLDENASHCRNCLERRIQSIGEEVGYGQFGDSPHFRKKAKPTG